MKDTIRISTDKSKFDLDLIHNYLTNSYWSKGIPVSTVAKAIEGSLCFAMFDRENRIGFARMITDKATFAYLADVFILEEYRGRGLCKQMMQFIIHYKDLQGLRRVVLATRDAHGLYHKFGFKLLSKPETFMERWSPDVYSD